LSGLGPTTTIRSWYDRVSFDNLAGGEETNQNWVERSLQSFSDEEVNGQRQAFSKLNCLISKHLPDQDLVQY
jgi:hypothetical protein